LNVGMYTNVMERVWGRRDVLLLTLPLLLSVFLRTYPYLLYRAPWGTDGWPLFHNTISILTYSPTRLGGNPAFDDYNIYWPGVSLFGAAASVLTGASPLTLMPLLIPFVASLTTFVIFVMAYRLTGNIFVASASSLIFAASSFDSIFTASVTKETFAYPIFAASLLPLMRRFNLKNLSAFTLLSFGVLLSHYALAFVLFLVALAVPTTGLVVGLLPGDDGLKRLLLPAALGLMGITYYLLYAYPSVLVVTLTTSQVVSMAGYLILSSGILSYVMMTKHAKSLDLMFLLLVVIVLGISTRFTFAPFAPTLTPGIAILSVPYIIVTILAMSGFRIFPRSGRSVFMTGWLSVPLALGGFALFSTPEGIGIIYRILTFIYAPASVLAAVALAGPWSRLRRWKGPLATVVVVAVVLASSLQSYDSVVLHSNLLGGQWAYYPSDIQSAAWTQSHVVLNGSLSGDARVSYLYSGFDGIPVHSSAGFEFLTGINRNLTYPLTTYSLMGVDGYDLNNFGQPLPSNWFSLLLNNLSLVYNNGNDMIWS